MTNRKTFNLALTHVFDVEGIESNNAHDAGGHTRFGISKRAHPDVDIDNLTLDQARDIYHKEYWFPSCEKLPDPLAIALFDGVVNHNPRSAIRCFQTALGVTADGIMGVNTRRAAQAAHWQDVLVRYCTQRAQLYHIIVLSNSTQAAFSLGWFSRLFKLQAFILSHYPINR